MKARGAENIFHKIIARNVEGGGTPPPPPPALLGLRRITRESIQWMGKFALNPSHFRSPKDCPPPPPILVLDRATGTKFGMCTDLYENYKNAFTCKVRYIKKICELLLINYANLCKIMFAYKQLLSQAWRIFYPEIFFKFMCLTLNSAKVANMHPHNTHKVHYELYICDSGTVKS